MFLVALALVALVALVASSVVLARSYATWRRRREADRRAALFREAERLPAHPLRWPVQRIAAGVIIATDPITGVRQEYSPARYGWVKA